MSDNLDCKMMTDGAALMYLNIVSFLWKNKKCYYYNVIYFPQVNDLFSFSDTPKTKRKHKRGFVQACALVRHLLLLIIIII